MKVRKIIGFIVSVSSLSGCGWGVICQPGGAECPVDSAVVVDGAVVVVDASPQQDAGTDAVIADAVNPLECVPGTLVPNGCGRSNQCLELGATGQYCGTDRQVLTSGPCVRVSGVPCTPPPHQHDAGSGDAAADVVVDSARPVICVPGTVMPGSENCDLAECGPGGVRLCDRTGTYWSAVCTHPDGMCVPPGGTYRPFRASLNAATAVDGCPEGWILHVYGARVAGVVPDHVDRTTTGRVQVLNTANWLAGNYRLDAECAATGVWRTWGSQGRTARQAGFEEFSLGGVDHRNDVLCVDYEVPSAEEPFADPEKVKPMVHVGTPANACMGPPRR